MSAIACFLAHDVLCKKGEELMFHGFSYSKEGQEEFRRKRERENEELASSVRKIMEVNARVNPDEINCKPPKDGDDMAIECGERDDEYYYAVEFNSSGDGITWEELETTRSGKYTTVKEQAEDIGRCFKCRTRVVKVARHVCEDKAQ